LKRRFVFNEFYNGGTKTGKWSHSFEKQVNISIYKKTCKFLIYRLF